MSAELTLSCVYGSCTSTISAYNEKTGELFVGVGRVIKKIKIRSGSASILKIETESTIQTISVEDEFLLIFDESSRIYLYNLFYNAEVGRMHTKECMAAYAKGNKVFLDYMGYLQIWIPEDNGFFTFKKDRHITGHQDSITLMAGTEEGILTGSKDGSLREYKEAENISIRIRKNKSQAIAARKVKNEVFAVWASGEISKFLYMNSEWVEAHRKFTMHNLVSSDISSFGDMAVVLDTNNNVFLYSTTSESKEPIQRVSVPQGTRQVKFIEQDEWIIISGNGSVIWEWKTNTLLFNEQASSQQRIAKDTGPAIISGTESGDIFIWDKGSSTCTKKISVHTSSVSAIIPVARGFVTISSGGECKVHKATGEVVKNISCNIAVLVGDADEDILAVAGPGHMHVYDIKRSKLVQEYEIDMPLSIKIAGSDILLVTMQGVTTYSPASVSGKDGPEQFVMGNIAETQNGLEIICLGESGVGYRYNRDMEEIGEYRILPVYTNGLGRTTPLGISHSREGDVVITYKVLRPDRITQKRETIYGSIFKNGQEIEKWKVLESAGRSSGFVFTEEKSLSGVVGVCSENGVLIFTEPGVGEGAGMWQNETPAEIEEKIREESDILGGLVGAVRLRNERLMKLALMKGDAGVLGRYFPIAMIEQALPLVFTVLRDGLVERSLIFIKETVKRTKCPDVLRRHLSLALSSAVETTHETTGYADALMEFRDIGKEEAE